VPARSPADVALRPSLTRPSLIWRWMGQCLLLQLKDSCPRHHTD
jgi:hypothetical protein